MATDELVVIDLPPGPEWVELVNAALARGGPVPPPRSPADRAGAAGDRRSRSARTSCATRGGETLLADAAPVTPGVAIVMPTSGTAGEPKLVELHRVAVVVAVSRSAKRLGATPGAPWLCPLTPAHIGGLLVLLRGGDPRRARDDARAVRPRAPRPRRRGRRVRLGRPGDGPPAGGVGPRAARPHARSSAATASTTETAGAARARGARLVTTYGLTETCGGFTYDGVPLDGMQVRLDADGAIEVSGSTVMEDYRLDPAATGRRVHDRRLAPDRRPRRDRRRRAPLDPRAGGPRDPDRRREGLARGGRAGARRPPQGADVAVAGQPATRSGDRT